MIEVNSGVILLAVAVNAKSNFHVITRLEEIGLHNLHTCVAFNFVNLGSETSGHF
jgi:hypothetical protein